MKRLKRIFPLLLALTLILTLLPAATLADDLEVHISSDPDDILYLPLGDENSGPFSINGIKFIPDITPGNCAKVEGGDLLMATLISSNPDFFKNLNASREDSGDSPITMENVFLRHGKVYVESPEVDDQPEIVQPEVPGLDNIYEELLRERDRLIEESLPDSFKSAPVKYTDQLAMRLLKGRNFYLERGDAPPITFGIGNVWQAPIPDKDYDPLSQYVPPETQPNTSNTCEHGVPENDYCAKCEEIPSE